MRTRSTIPSLCLLLVVACDDPDAAEETSTDDGASASDDSSSDGGPPAADPPPTDGDALEGWLAEGRYLAWAAESQVHPSAGPHGSGGVRTFVDGVLLASLDAGTAVHPVGASVVKELYGASGIIGFAVMVKVEDGTGGASWYWYENVGDTIYADGVDVGLCTGCHEDGMDQILTPYPLQ